MSRRPCENRTASPLLHQSIDYICANLHVFQHQFDIILQFPQHIRNRLLHIFTITPYYWNHVDFKLVLRTLSHSQTDHINLTTVTVDDEMLKIIECCTGLKQLYLTRVMKHSMTTEGLLSLIPNLTKLQYVQILKCDAVDDSVLESIGRHCPSLSALDVGGCKSITDKSLFGISRLKHLQWATFSNTQISDTGLEQLVCGPSGEKLKELRVAECRYVTDKVLNMVAENCPQMEILVFYNCCKMQDLSCFSFQEGKLKNLKQLNWTIAW